MIVALVGVMKSGAAYVPMDPTYPKERLRYILDDARAAIVLTQTDLTRGWSFGDAVVVCLDGDWKDISRGETGKPAELSKADDLAYVIYTSGSTGTPKGVEVPHRGLANLLQSMRVCPGLAETDVLAAVTTLSFDIAALELLLPICVGATLAIVDRERAQYGVQLLEYLKQIGATVMQATPVTWKQLIEAGWSSDGPKLKVLCGGEAMSRELANELITRSESVWNMYGPTETTIWSAVARVDSEQGPVPIGRPIANTQLYVLSEDLQSQPVGVAGELYIGGRGVARGYWNQPELTAQRFIHDPFSNQAGARMYRTGDVVRRRADGLLEFLGRNDDQVKLRGFRIELGEIESALKSHPAVAEAVVVLREDVPGDKRLVSYLVSKGKGIPSGGELRDFVKLRLPAYMAPAAYILVNALPLTPNGKLDRRALPAPDWSKPSDESKFVAPRNDDERTIADIWSEVLKIARVGVNDDLFELGADSLHVFQIAARARKAGLGITPRQILEQRTVAGLVMVINKSAETSAQGPSLKAFMRSKRAGRANIVSVSH
jgi:amino acid adenylation domain-containing protein